MIKRILYAEWALMFALCAALGFVPNPQGAVYWGLFALSLLFFVPPGILLYRAYREGDRREPRRIGVICLISLGLTLTMLVLNFLSVGANQAAGNMVYWILIVVSTPMICGRIWVVSLFAWACLLMVALRLRKGKV